MNVVGFCEPMLINFGAENGLTAKILPEGRYWTILYSTILLLICSGISLKQELFAKTGRWLFVILIFSTFTVPFSAFFVKPFIDEKFGEYTGFSFSTIKENLLPSFRPVPGNPVMNFQILFGIFFPSTAGIFAGASMSGDLKKPSVSIPQGTLKGLLLTFISYSLVIFTMGSCISRTMLYRDVQVLQDVNINKYFIIMGEFSTSLFSAIVGIIGSAKQLQAVARDEVIPFTSPFANGTPGTDDPIEAVIFTYLLAQVIIFFDVNQIATFITMAFLMTFIVTNLACFLLRVASAPNFRPSFRYFNTYTAAAGAAASVAAMFVADGMSASLMIIVLTSLFLTIHYISPPKPWGDVSQSLIYHQVRKYLLRLRQDHVKFWRPQILLLVDDPRSAWSLIAFCNNLKKGGLYILGHVIVTKDFQQSFDEIKKQQNAWIQLRDLSNVKAFVQIGAGPDVVWGARNVYLGSGLGGMKPNITVLGFFEKRNHIAGAEHEQVVVPYDTLPTDSCRQESTINVTQWVNIIEDLLIMRANVAIAKGFLNLNFPSSSSKSQYGKSDSGKKYIDLYPIQMSAQIIDENGETSALTTNFDTYTLILQMGAILNTVPAWKQNHELRVIVFVELEEDVEEERSRINVLLERLRIKAEVLVMCLSSGDIEAYEIIVRGKKDQTGRVTNVLSNLDWWQELQEARLEYEKTYGIIPDLSKPGTIPSGRLETLFNNPDNAYSLQDNGLTLSPSAFSKILKNQRQRRHTVSSLQQMGISFSMHTNKLLKSQMKHATDFFRDDVDEYSSESDSAFTSTESDSLSSSMQDLLATRHGSKGGLSLLDNSHNSNVTDRFPKGTKKTSSTTGLEPLNFDKKNVSDGVSGPPESLLGSSSLTSGIAAGASSSTLATGGGYSSGYASDTSASRSGTSTPNTTGSRKNKSRPNFSGQAMPNTTVKEIDDGRPTIMFDKSTQKKKKPLDKRNVTFETSAKESTPLIGHKSPSYESTNPSNEDRGEEIKNEEATIGLFKNGYQFGSSNGDVRNSSINEENEDVEDDDDDDEDDDDQGAYLSFNDLPADAQHLILNDLMRKNSEDTAVIFSTLPAPSLGTHLSEEDSYQYVESLEVWCQNLPPTLLLHSQTITVTTAL